jgi:glycine hydroxymethyltransferase
MAAPETEESRLASLVRAHDRWRGREVFNLLPSENSVSPTARRYLASDLAGRYTLPMDQEYGGEVVDNSYAGTRYTDQIERLGNEVAGRLYHGRFATIRPLSGHLAALSALVPLLPAKSKILAISPAQGGYDGYAPGYVPALYGYTVRPLPANGIGFQVDAAEAVDEIRRERPNAVILGQSQFLFPYPLREVAEAAHAQDALVFYDGSHVMGLLAGGEFQDPLREGADVLYGSTHKSLPGPQGGIVVTDREDLFRQVDPALVWRIFDNAHWNRIAGVTQTLLELERAGADYAKTVVANAQALGGALDGLGFPLVAKSQGFTRSHQLLIDLPTFRTRHRIGPGTLARCLEKNRLLVDLIGRIGTAEITRWGLVPADMHRMASLLVRAGVGQERIAAEVLAWRRTFRRLRFV